MKSLNELIISLLPKTDEMTSASDIQITNSLRDVLSSKADEMVTVETAMLNDATAVAIALGKTSKISSNFELFTNIIRYLRSMIMSRINFGSPMMPNVNNIIPTIIRLPIVGKNEIATTSVKTNKFKYITYEKNKLTFDLHNWLREAIDWTIKQGNLYITLDNHTYVVEVSERSPNEEPYCYKDEYSIVHFINFEDIVNSNQQYLMDLHYSFNYDKFIQINKRRVCSDEDKKSAYYDELVEESDMTKFKENKLKRLYTSIQNNILDTYPASSGFLTSMYTDKELICGVTENHKYEKIFGEYSNTSIYTDHIYPINDIDPDVDIKFEITRHGESIMFGDKKFIEWFERQRTDDKVYKISNATTRQITTTNYEKYVIEDGVEKQIECRRDVVTSLTVQYPEYKRTIKEETFMYNPTSLESLVNGTELSGPYNVIDTTITNDGINKDMTKELSVSWTYLKPETLATDNDDSDVVLRMGEQLVMEFEHDLTQIPLFTIYGYLYPALQQLDVFKNKTADMLRELFKNAIDYSYADKDYYTILAPIFFPNLRK